MSNLILGFIRDERGEGLIEYGLMAAFIGGVALATLVLDPLHIRDAVVGALRKGVNALLMAAQGDLEMG